MKEYLNLLRWVIEKGKDRVDRTGVGTRSVFGAQMRVDLAAGFPLLTTKKVHFKSIVTELLWFLRGDTSIKFLKDNGVTIWDEWAHKITGDVGPIYGKQWRKWDKFEPTGWGIGRALTGAHNERLCRHTQLDQVKQLIEDLKKNPFSRRHIVTAWNPVDVPKMKLPPCHTLWQCYVSEESNGTTKKLHLHLYARSIDIFLGLPFNIASYALLLTILAGLTDMEPGELIISFGDLHLYKNHFEQAELQLKRDTKRLPTLRTPDWKLRDLDSFVVADFSFADYDPHPAIKAPIAV